MTEFDELVTLVQNLTIEVRLLQKDICWVKMILKWVIVGIGAIFGVQVPGWITT